jgi:hypothetical protein
LDEELERDGALTLAGALLLDGALTPEEELLLCEDVAFLLFSLLVELLFLGEAVVFLGLSLLVEVEFLGDSTEMLFSLVEALLLVAVVAPFSSLVEIEPLVFESLVEASLRVELLLLVLASPLEELLLLVDASILG